MKKYNLAIWLAMVVSWVSCNKDLGNYTYSEMNTFTISGIAENYLVRSLIDTLRIKPVLDMSIPDTDLSRYDHRWILRLNVPTINSHEDTISKSPQLEYPIDLRETDYNLVYQLYDRETKVRWEKTCMLQVKAATARGIMIMGEDENQHADIDMVTMVFDTTVVSGLLSRSGLPPLRDPIGVQMAGGLINAYNKLWVFTGEGSYYLDRTSFKGNSIDNFSKISYTNLPLTHEDLTPVVMAPQINEVNGGVAEFFARVMVTKTGYIFGGNTIENGGDYYVNAINRDLNNLKEYLPAAPFLFYPVRNMTNMLWYDTKNDRFMNIPSFYSNTASLPLTDEADDIFPWNQKQVGRKLIYGENSHNADAGGQNGNSFALMKDMQNNYMIYKFYANGSRPLKLGFYPIKETVAKDFDRASLYAFSSYRTLLFYVVGNKLYAYDYNPENEKLYEIQVSGNDVITMIKFDTQINPTTNGLYIATYNTSTQGTLQRFTLGTNPNSVELIAVENEKWNNLVKIKNISWRANN